MRYQYLQISRTLIALYNLYNHIYCYNILFCFILSEISEVNYMSTLDSILQLYSRILQETIFHANSQVIKNIVRQLPHQEFVYFNLPFFCIRELYGYHLSIVKLFNSNILKQFSHPPLHQTPQRRHYWLPEKLAPLLLLCSHSLLSSGKYHLCDP